MLTIWIAIGVLWYHADLSWWPFSFLILLNIVIRMFIEWNPPRK